MAQPLPGPSGPISLDELIAFNDELSALVRQGAPLASGLAGASELRGRLGQLSAALADRLRQGQSLDDALAAMQPAVPPLYALLVRTGQRSGRLCAALEGLATTARRMQDVNRSVGLALAYPLLVLGAASGVFAFLVIKILPVLLSFAVAPWPAMARIVRALADSAHLWGIAIPLAIVAIAGIWAWSTSRASVLGEGRSRRALAAVPLAGRVLRNAGWSALADVLALLIEHGVPLVEALPLAARTLGDSRLAAGVEQWAAELARGAGPTIESARRAGLPPYLAWLIAANARQTSLVAALQHAAESYRQRATRSADWLRTGLPIIALVVLAGVPTLLLALSLFVPFSRMLRELARMTM